MHPALDLPPQPTLDLPIAVRTAIAAWASALYPAEACGLLLGRRGDRTTFVVSAQPARNLHESPNTRYELDPADFLAADETARALGLDVVGVWHSHPDRPAVPSASDRAAAWPEWSYVIVSVAKTGVRELRSWRLADARFVEQTLQP